MNKKIGVVIIIVVGIAVTALCVRHQNVNKIETKQDSVPIVSKPKVDKSTDVQPPINPRIEKTIKTNLYQSVSDNSLPLNSIRELYDLPNEIKNFVSEILDNSNKVYLIKKNGNKVIVVYDNPQNYRHGIDVTIISLENGEFSTTLFTESSDSEQDEWEYDEQNEYEKRPIKHVKYNTEGEIVYTEIWNNNPNEEIKYEKTDAKGRPISINKEVLDENGGMRQEHLIYDKDGNTEFNVSTAFEGTNLVRFTYYDLKNPENSTSIFNEFSENGEKTKETVYTSDLKLQNTYIPKLQNGERHSITVFDSENKVISNLLSE